MLNHFSEGYEFVLILWVSFQLQKVRSKSCSQVFKLNSQLTIHGEKAAEKNCRLITIIGVAWIIKPGQDYHQIRCDNRPKITIPLLLFGETSRLAGVWAWCWPSCTPGGGGRGGEHLAWLLLRTWGQYRSPAAWGSPNCARNSCGAWARSQAPPALRHRGAGSPTHRGSVWNMGSSGESGSHPPFWVAWNPVSQLRGDGKLNDWLNPSYILYSMTFEM